MLKKLVAVVLCVTFSSCVTIHQLPTTAHDIQTTKFDPKQKYYVHTENGYSVREKGANVVADEKNLHIKDANGKIISSIPLSSIDTLQEEKFSAGKTALIIAGSLAAVGAILAIVIVVGLKKADKGA